MSLKDVDSIVAWLKKVGAFLKNLEDTKRERIMLGKIIDHIENQPTIDPIHAAGACYCRECEYYMERICRFYSPKRALTPCHTKLLNVYMKPDDFCSYGSRREDTEEMAGETDDTARVGAYTDDPRGHEA